jgi:HAMP domain-containing protein
MILLLFIDSTIDLIDSTDRSNTMSYADSNPETPNQEISQENRSPDQQLAEIESLRQVINHLKQENSDLEILLENTTEHSTRIEIELHEKNEEMKEYLRQVHCVTSAAAAVEEEKFQLSTLDGMLDAVGLRSDGLGQLARVFKRMITQVKQREELLKRQVEELKIEIDQTKRAQQVSQITQTDYFQELKQKAKKLRDSSENSESL